MNLEQLIYQLKQGDEKAFRELIVTFSKRLMTVAKVYTNSTEDAEDVLQDTFIKIFRKISTFEGTEEKFFYGWMKRIAINIALSKKRKKSYTMEHSLEAMKIDRGYESDILGRLTEKEIMNYVFNLPAGYRQVFALYVIEGYSHKEIAERLNINPATSRSQFVRARKLLQLKINNNFKLEVQ